MNRGTASLCATLFTGLLVLGLSVPVRSSEAQPAPATAKALFAGGCFWCMEPPFEKLDGVVSVISGYAGGPEKDPTYKQVSAGLTGHTESVQVEYDPAKIGYEKLLEVYWRNVDPTTADRQFCDWGKQYRPAIFYANEAEKRLAEESRNRIEQQKRFSEPIVVEIVPAGEFYAAEDYHQDFYKKNPEHYRRYRAGCGRDQRLAELWGN
jgi:peptide-methionine (S)-S-oxide reductase